MSDLNIKVNITQEEDQITRETLDRMSLYLKCGSELRPDSHKFSIKICDCSLKEILELAKLGLLVREKG